MKLNFIKIILKKKYLLRTRFISNIHILINMSVNEHLGHCISFFLSPEDDMDNCLNKFFAFYTRSLLLNCDEAWVLRAGETIKYMNELRLLKEDEDTRDSIRKLFNNND